jgi:sialidase-1
MKQSSFHAKLLAGMAIPLCFLSMDDRGNITSPARPAKDTIDTRTGKFTSNGIWIHPACRELTGLRMGPFVNMPDGSLLTVDTTKCYVSRDEGKTWTSFRIFKDTSTFLIRMERALIRTRKGTLILAFMNEKEHRRSWNSLTHDAPGAVLPTYVVRSHDNGRTWQEPQLMHREWTGAIRDIIETQDGHVIFTSMMLLTNPGRNSVLTYASRDDGHSWTRSNIIDLGGIGHHSGVTESTLEEMKDGSLRMYMRTNWGSLWEARSRNHGRTWDGFRSTPIMASSAPAMFKRLKSGRLLLVWNQSMPQGKTSYPLRGGDREWSEVFQSNHREELSVSFSDDEGEHWSSPVVIAKVTKPNTQVSYPYVLERNPGEIWITTMFGGLRMSFLERDFSAR